MKQPLLTKISQTATKIAAGLVEHEAVTEDDEITDEMMNIAYTRYTIIIIYSF